MKKIHKGFNDYWINQLGNNLTENISKNNNQIIDVFDTVVKDNKACKSNKYIIASATGTGKTQNMSYYIAHTLDRGFKSLIVVERTESADELQKLIKKLSDANTLNNSYHSKDTSTVKTISEAVDSQVLIITHSKFNNILLESNMVRIWIREKIL